MEISFEKGKFVYCPGGFNYQEVLDDFKRAKKVRIITYNCSHAVGHHLCQSHHGSVVRTEL